VASTNRKSAIKKAPSFTLGTSLASLDKQRNDPKLQQYRGQISEAIKKMRAQAAAPVTPPPTTQQPTNDWEQTPQYSNYENVGNAAFGVMGNQFNQINQQGAFNPGSFQETQQQAYDSVMSEFNRTMQPQFKRQQNDFAQMAAERGLDPNSEAYKTLNSQMMEQQNQAQQGAMNSAFGQGLGAQAQAYGQAYQTYQSPYQNLQAMTPFYGEVGNNWRQNDMQGFQGGQSALDRQQQIDLANLGQGFNVENASTAQKYAMAQLAFQAANQKRGGGGGGGGGGTSLADQMALQNNAFYNQMALMGGQQQQQPNMANSAINGVAQGVSAGIVNSLAK
jgi:hypothetical protein